MHTLYIYTYTAIAMESRSLTIESKPESSRPVFRPWLKRRLQKQNRQGWG